jgi:hypothetical protein
VLRAWELLGLGQCSSPSDWMRTGDVSRDYELVGKASSPQGRRRRDATRPRSSGMFLCVRIWPFMINTRLDLRRTTQRAFALCVAYTAVVASHRRQGRSVDGLPNALYSTESISLSAGRSACGDGAGARDDVLAQGKAHGEACWEDAARQDSSSSPRLAAAVPSGSSGIPASMSFRTPGPWPSAGPCQNRQKEEEDAARE